MDAGIDLDAAITAKFNATSEKNGLSTRLSKLMPVTALPFEATPEMVNAALDLVWEESETHGDLVCRLWRAMAAAAQDQSAAARDVLAERNRQIDAEGWTPEHDDKYSSGQLAYAASVYALCAASSDADRSVMDEFRTYNSVPFRIRNRWPWDESWLKPTNRRRDLVKAAALILAEIERLDRKASEGGSNV